MVDSKHLGSAMIAVALTASVVVGYLAIELFSVDPDPRTPDGGAAWVPTQPEGERPALPAIDPAEADLSGRVVDIAGEPIAGVTVTAEAEAAAASAGAAAGADADAAPGLVIGGAVVAATTGGDGRFALGHLGSGHVRLKIEGGGVVSSEVRFVAVPQRDLDIVASREVSIAGRVIGDGVAAGIAVEAVGESTGGATTTDATGAFEIKGLPEGVYRVWAASGELGSPAVRVERRGAGPFAPVELAMVPAAIISGRLIDAETGAALAGRVVLTHSGDEPPRSAEVGPDGRFAIDGVPAGRWYADAEAPGYVGAEQLVFEADRSRELSLRLSRGGSIAGTVVDPDGVPVAGALVEADDQGGGAARARVIVPTSSMGGDDGFIARGELGVMTGPIPYPPPQPVSAARVAEPIAAATSADSDLGASQRLTDAGGRFRIAGLKPGRYRVLASHADFAGGASAPIPIELGADREGVEVVMQRGVRVRGVVRDERGDPIVAALIAASSAAPMPLRARTDVDGRFELPPLSGAISITASAPGYSSASETLARPADGDEVELTLTRADAFIAGRVADSSGFAIRGARLAVEDQPAAGAVTDASGRFEMRHLAEGKHEVVITHPDYPEHRVTLEVGRGHEIEVPIGGGVEGLVVDTNSRRPMAATVALRPADKPKATALTSPGGAASRRRSPATTTTGAGDDGRFSIAPLPAGRYRLTATATGYAPSSVTVEVPAGDRPRQITARDVQLELARGASVAGTVRDENGERVSGAVVRAGGVQSRSDIDGRFALEDVPAVKDLAITARRGDRRGQITLTLAPGDELTTVEITIEP